MAKVTVITPTYNKPQIADCFTTLLHQTCQDWLWWIVLNDATEEVKAICEGFNDPRITLFHEDEIAKERESVYIPARIMNLYYPKVETKYMIWLSDDDLLFPLALASMTNYLDDTGNHICYGSCERQMEYRHNPGVYHHWNWIHSNQNLSEPYCVIDHGQFMQTSESGREVLKDWSVPEDMINAHVCDGIYMNKLGERHIFHGINSPVSIKRVANNSTNHRPQDQGTKINDIYMRDKYQ